MKHSNLDVKFKNRNYRKKDLRKGIANFTYKRYNIVNDQDLRDAAQKKQAYFEKQEPVELSDPGRGEVIQFRQAQNE